MSTGKVRDTSDADEPGIEDRRSVGARYGFGPFVPDAIQVFNNVKAALVFLCSAIFAQSMLVNGFARSVVTSLERRFGLTSTDLGSVIIANDVANLIASIPIGYLCARNKPRWLGCGMVLMALGSFIFATPHFAAASRQVVAEVELSGFCINQTLHNLTARDEMGCAGQSADETLLTGYKYVFVFGKFLVGTGACALFSLGVTYINENTPATQTSVYLGIFYAFSIVGPGVGYLLNSAFLNIPADLDYSTTISPDSPQWVGAWWVGFLLSGAMALVSAVFLFGFPRKLPALSDQACHHSANTEGTTSTKHEHGNESVGIETTPTSHTPGTSDVTNPGNKSQDMTAMQTSNPPGASDVTNKSSDIATIQISNPSATSDLTKTAIDETTTPKADSGKQHVQFVKQFWEKFVRLMKNPTLILLSLATVTEKGMVSGIVTFTPKYVEAQFRTTAAEASFIVGLVTVPAATIGTLLGGFLVKKLQLGIRGIAKFCFVVTSLTLVTSLTFLVTCDDVTFAGVNAVYRNSSFISTQNPLTSWCNAACHCSRDSYSPVCGSDHVVYFSPCHAGCDNLTAANGSKVYEGCQCAGDGVTSLGLPQTAIEGKCPVDCPLKPLFYGLLFFTSLGCFITLIPLLTGTLRSVTTEEGPFATGIQEVFVRGLGYIPCILLVGSIIDYACVLWDTSCQNAGSCLLYRNSNLSTNMVSVCVAYKAASCLIYCFVLLFHKETQSEESVKDTV